MSEDVQPSITLDQMSPEDREKVFRQLIIDYYRMGYRHPEIPSDIDRIVDVLLIYGGGIGRNDGYAMRWLESALSEPSPSLRYIRYRNGESDE